jgi:hypothetical protein
VRHGCRTQAPRDGFTACPGKPLLLLWPERLTAELKNLT